MVIEAKLVLIVIYSGVSMLPYIILPALAGLLLPIQGLINARSGAILGSPFWATLINFVSGTVAVIIILTLTRVPVPSWEQVGRMPAYGWITGFFGMFFVTQAVITLPKLGAAAMFAVLITAQMIASLAYDHFGVLNTAHPVTSERLVGVILLLAGVFLILRPVR